MVTTGWGLAGVSTAGRLDGDGPGSHRATSESDSATVWSPYAVSRSLDSPSVADDSTQKSPAAAREEGRATRSASLSYRLRH